MGWPLAADLVKVGHPVCKPFAFGWAGSRPAPADHQGPPSGPSPTQTALSPAVHGHRQGKCPGPLGGLGRAPSSFSNPSPQLWGSSDLLSCLSLPRRMFSWTMVPPKTEAQLRVRKRLAGCPRASPRPLSEPCPSCGADSDPCFWDLGFPQHWVSTPCLDAQGTEGPWPALAERAGPGGLFPPKRPHLGLLLSPRRV